MIFFSGSSAQTSISGVVNSYYKVLEVFPAKSGVRLNTTVGLAQGDKAMLVQMKGASINTSTGSTFGDTTSLNNAGNYEVGDICYVRADTVFFVYILLSQYTAGSKVQLVRIPQYVSAIVTDTLKAAQWNNTTGTGGVLAIFVEQNLTLNAPISADSSGYKGGGFVLSDGTCFNAIPASNYYYNATSTAPQNGAYKGEGVVEITNTYSGGRGAPANGGGGGNNHNNGGAGGANLNAGGNGGGNSSSAGCTTSLFGRGGKALSSYGGTKIFLGGGGGAGHANNGLVPTNGGGRGGGIIFLRADSLAGNGKKISANGQLGGPALGDGASGGGAGGTIIMDVDKYSGPATIESNGGTGGTENDGGNSNRCYGAGGGGSGGAIYFSGSTPALTVNVTGGAAGPETGRDVAGCAAAVLPSAGSNGQVIQNYTYTASLVLENNYCSLLLPTDLIWFRANYSNGQAVLSWKVTEPETIDHFVIERSADRNNWIAIYDQPIINSVYEYKYVDPSIKQGSNYYRIRVVKLSSAVSYSRVQKIYLQPKNTIRIYPNPATNKIFITGIMNPEDLDLYDMLGKLVWRKSISPSQGTIEVLLPSLSTGVYVVRIGNSINRLMIK